MIQGWAGRVRAHGMVDPDAWSAVAGGKLLGTQM